MSGQRGLGAPAGRLRDGRDRKSTRLNSSHLVISYAVFCLKKKKDNDDDVCYASPHHRETMDADRLSSPRWRHYPAVFALCVQHSALRLSVASKCACFDAV